MILVFILLGILILILLLLSLILFSTLKIQIKDLQTANFPLKEKLQYEINISLYLFNHVKWLSISLNKAKIKKAIQKIPLQKIDVKKIEQDFKLQDITVLKKLKINLSNFYLEADLGLESPISTAFIIALISSFISILLPHLTKEIKENQYKYTIQPIYQNKNLYKIRLNCIIELKMVHIINVIYILIKKGKSDENERTTSNRKSYGYSYE